MKETQIDAKYRSACRTLMPENDIETLNVPCLDIKPGEIICRMNSKISNGNSVD